MTSQLKQLWWRLGVAPWRLGNLPLSTFRKTTAATGRAAAAVHEDQIAIRQGLPKGARELRFLAFHSGDPWRSDRCWTSLNMACFKTAACPRSLSMEMCLLGKFSIFGFCFLAGIWRNGFMMLWVLVHVQDLPFLQRQAYQPLPKIQQKIAPKTFSVWSTSFVNPLRPRPCS